MIKEAKTMLDDAKEREEFSLQQIFILTRDTLRLYHTTREESNVVGMLGWLLIIIVLF
jgi:hypothetical protein